MLDVVADMLTEIEADNFFETVGDVKGKALVDTLSDTLSVLIAKTIADTLPGWRPTHPSKEKFTVEAYTVAVTFNKIKAEALV